MHFLPSYMNLYKFSVNRPVATIMLMLVALLIGVVSLGGLSMDLLPKIDAPVLVVVTTFPGAGPEEVDLLVTEPIEKAVATTGGVKTVSSISREGLSAVVVLFNWGVDVTDARRDVQERLDRLMLPNDVDKPYVMRYDPTQMPIMQLSVFGEGSMEELTRLAEENIIPRIEAVEGVASVGLIGGEEREVLISLNQEALIEYDVTQERIVGLIQASNLNYPLGYIQHDDRSLNLRYVGRMESMEDLSSLVVSQRPVFSETGEVSLESIHLADVATIEDRAVETKSINRTNGMPSIGLTIQKEGDANTVLVSGAVRDELDKLSERYDVSFVAAVDEGAFIEQSLENVATSLVIGGLLAALVLLLFLKSIRTTLIVAIAIPFSILVTFILMYFRGLTINIMTLGGLALGVGMLVDNSIVVVENIHRHLQLGASRKDAALKGTGEVARAITAATLTTLAVFLPLAFIGGLTGELFKELALTVSFALIASLLVALTVIPMLSSLFASKAPGSGKHSRRESFYTRVLKGALKHPYVTLLIALALLGGSFFFLYPAIGTEFLPTADEGTFVVSVSLPVGTNLDTTQKKVREFEDIILAIPEVESVTSQIGAGAGIESLRSSAVGGTHSAELWIKLIPVVERNRTTEEVMLEVRRQIEPVRGEAEVAYNLQSAMAAASGQPSTLEVIVKGSDPDILREIVPGVMDEIAQVDGVVRVESNLEMAKEEVHLAIDQDKASQFGLYPGQITTNVSQAIRGTNVGRMADGTNINVRYDQEYWHNSKALEELMIKSPTGAWVALGEVSELKESTGPLTITKENGQVTAQLVGYFEGRDLGSITSDVTNMAAELDLPEGYSVELVGASQMMQEGFDDLKFALILAIFLVYMILAAQFESLAKPFSIIFSMPFAAIGILVALYLTNIAFGITAFMGVIMLVGIVVNNGIVLVDFTNQLKEQGLNTTAAIIEAARTRLRPVLMTAITTTFGLLPLALARGEGAELQQPLAWAVIGGLTSATLITLIIVPVGYSLIDGFSSRKEKEDQLGDLAGAVISGNQGGYVASSGYQQKDSEAFKKEDFKELKRLIQKLNRYLEEKNI